AEDWVNVVHPETGMKGRRETNTMPQWAGSCWYYLRYIDPHNDEALADPEALKRWLPVDMYIGGAEHAVLHLLYARFWHKVLYDIGVVPTKEPFQKLYNQGMVLKDSEKMSKSRGNTVDPDDIINSHGADTLRLYEMFMGPLDSDVNWSTKGLDGSKRFLDRVWRLIINEDGQISEKIIKSIENSPLERVYHETVKKVSEDFNQLHFNTGISQMMVFINEANKQNEQPREYAEGFSKLLSPVAPHLCEEIWNKLGNEGSLAYIDWPSYDEAKLVEDEIEIVLQVMGRVRSRIKVAKGTSKDELEKLALEDETIKGWIEGKTIRKIIAVPDRLVNIVAN